MRIQARFEFFLEATMNRTLLSGLMLSILLASPAWAHDAKYHKGKPVEGTVQDTRADGFDLKTEKETIKVTYDKELNVEHGDSHVTREAIHAGDKVGVLGTRLASGDLVAHEVLISPAK